MKTVFDGQRICIQSHFIDCLEFEFISLRLLSNGHYPFLIVYQSDNLLSYLTVEETLLFTAQLALRQHSSGAIRKKVIQDGIGDKFF